MAVWRQVLVLFFLLHCVESSAPSPALQRNKYSNSFRLARSTRIRVQQLQKKYTEQQLGNKNYEDRSQQVDGLPQLSTDFHSWLQLTDGERLHAAFRDIQTFWNMLERKRKQLEEREEEEEQTARRAVRNTLPRRIRHVQLDLRDLMTQVSHQMSHLETSWMRPNRSATAQPWNPESSATSGWDSRVEGYIILRDLDLYLIKLARDFLLLASKTHDSALKP